MSSLVIPQAMALELTTALGFGSGEYTVRDIWAGEELPGTVTGSATLHTVVKEAHGTNFLILTPSK